jgi:hypothetical protein
MNRHVTSINLIYRKLKFQLERRNKVGQKKKWTVSPIAEGLSLSYSWLYPPLNIVQVCISWLLTFLWIGRLYIPSKTWANSVCNYTRFKKSWWIIERVVYVGILINWGCEWSPVASDSLWHKRGNIGCYREFFCLIQILGSSNFFLVIQWGVSFFLLFLSPKLRCQSRSISLIIR